MGYRSLADCVADLRKTDQLLEIDAEVDPRLEVAAVQRRVYEAQGPALLFRRVRGCAFPVLGNLFGTIERTRWLFRDTLEAVRHLVELKVSPPIGFKRPWRYLDVPGTGLNLLPRRVRSGPILGHRTTVSKLPQIVSWPGDGGAFVTLPQVYTEDPDRPGLAKSNLGMYRVQLSGNAYEPDREVGLHYQIHRGIGVHHSSAIRRGEPLRVNVFVGGPPAMTVAAVMPLPEGLPELSFAGALGGRAVRMVHPPDWTLPMPAEADFVICGTIDPDRVTRPEGPFGDHLGYYAMVHDFPFLRVDRVYHRPGAIWPFTSVGRPPQEDTSFGQLIHDLTGPLVPTVLPGVKAVHAVDEAGVHPLLLAIGSERYVPYASVRRPQEILTQANAILGQGQMSLAKYLLIVAQEDDPGLDLHDTSAFLRHLLERADWEDDLHFQTRTTIDTLDYSGHGFNQGSKVVIACAGPRRRELPTEVPEGLNLPDGFSDPRVALPGVLAVQAPPFSPDRKGEDQGLAGFCWSFEPGDPINAFPMVVLVDDSDFATRSIRNFLWVTFTRSNPAADLAGIGAFTHQKHWGCKGSLVVDARIKPHHAPPLEDDPEVDRRVDALGAPGGPLHGII
ncbi:UbiD family decarboxylase [Tautonia plasticadhaerens]|uniref:4-hydroxybenzoate decarboxylase subunit C n=1 Tax=Tautonia plasticadhaerens TaxID=2527974 RepID=A0A518H5D5_9BACT|nr:UbiD family decarboxylase [Tautonia plasticadhaerens]QDV36050.1 4-hydroxybenzoate decarboxylase subunit C [Tautonia plasticadhaerens]